MTDLPDQCPPFLDDYEKMIDCCAVVLEAMYLLTLREPENADINAATGQRFVALASHAGNVSMLKVLRDVNAAVKDGRQPHQDVMSWVNEIAKDISVDPIVGRS